jgi:hypothetical protein
MGYSSYLCKHCDKGIVDASATNEGINEWMAHVVMMTANGSRMVEPEYDGYEGHYERFCDGAVWVHNACWEIAGKPEFDAYDGPSGYDPDQGGGSFRGSLDIIDPRITDEAERARLLAEGIAARTKKRYDHNARQVHDWTDQEDSEYHREKHNGEMFRQRYTYGNKYSEDGEGGYTKHENAWVVYDELDRERDEVTYAGTEDELKAHLTALWNAFQESDEHAAYIARAEEMTAAYYAEQIEKFKTEGRFKTTYGPKQVDGQEVWPVHQVKDDLHYRMDKEWFHGDGAKARCQAKADKLNEAWAAAGHPDKFSEGFDKVTYEDEDEEEEEEEAV